MAEQKTRQTRARVADFLNGIEDRQKRGDLGAVAKGKSCLYIRRLSDVDERVLARLIGDSVKEMGRKYGG